MGIILNNTGIGINMKQTEKSAIFVANKSLVIPGKILAEGRRFIAGNGTFREGNQIISKYVGLVYFANDKFSVVAMRGPYEPSKGDIVIGVIEDIRFSNWVVDIGAPYSATLSISEIGFDINPDEMKKTYRKGDAILCKIEKIEKRTRITLTMKEPGLKKLKDGRILMISPPKVPRLIGKGGSMVSMLKNLTSCHIVVGQNGRVFISGPAHGEKLAEKAINLVEKEAHVSGLTDKIKLFLEEEQIGRK